MHDIDTVRMELEGEGEGFNYESEFASEAPMTEAEEEMLASELLSVTSEAEMEEFLGKLFKRVSKGISGAGKFLKKNAGPLAGALKGIAKAALPTVGAALGTAIPIPGVGTALGGMLGNAAASALEAELEGLSQEDREYEMAKRFVRLTGHTAQAGARRPPTMNRRAAVVAAIRDALRRMRPQQIALARARGTRFRPRPTTQVTFQDTAGAGGGSDAGFDFGVTADDAADAVTGGDLDAVDLGGADDGDAASGEYEWETPTAPGGARSGRWVRRGGKIVLLGV